MLEKLFLLLAAALQTATWSDWWSLLQMAAFIWNGVKNLWVRARTKLRRRPSLPPVVVVVVIDRTPPRC